MDKNFKEIIFLTFLYNKMKLTLLLIVSMSFYFSLYQGRCEAFDINNIDFNKLPPPEKGPANTEDSAQFWDNFSKQQKVKIIESVIEKIKNKEGIIIKKSAEFYVEKIDDVRSKNLTSLNYPIGIVFRTIAVVEYDFDEGISKEITAKKYLGDYYEQLEIEQLEKQIGINNKLSKPIFRQEKLYTKVDDIKMLEYMGILYIGLKAKRLRTIWGEPISIINKNGEEIWLYSNFWTKKIGDKITIHIRNGEVVSWEEIKNE